MCASETSQKDEEKTDWQRLIDELGPRFADRARDHDENDTFVADNYADLKEHRFFSAQIPTELGGGGLLHSEMCDLIRRLAELLQLDRSGHLHAPAPGGRLGVELQARQPGSKASREGGGR